MQVQTTISSSSSSSSVAQQKLSDVLVADIEAQSTCSPVLNELLHRTTSSTSSWSSRSSRSSKHTSRSNPLITIYDHSVPEVPIHELCLQGLERLSSLPVRQRPSILNNSTLKDRRLLFVPPLDSRGRAIQGRCWSRKSAQQYAIVQAQARAQAQLLSQHFSSQPSQLSRSPSRHSFNQDTTSNTRDLVRSALALGNPSVGNVTYHTVHASLLEDYESSHSLARVQPQQAELVSEPAEPKWELVMSSDDEDEEVEEEDEDLASETESQDQQDTSSLSSFSSHRRNSFSHEPPSVLQPRRQSSPTPPSTTFKGFEMDYDIDVQVGFSSSSSSSSESESEVDLESESESDNDSEESFDSSSSTPTSDEEEVEVEMLESKPALQVNTIQASDSPRDVILTMKPISSTSTNKPSNDKENFDYEWKTIDSYPEIKSQHSKSSTAFGSRSRPSPYSTLNRRHSRSKGFSQITLPIPAYLNPSFESSTRPVSRH